MIKLRRRLPAIVLGMGFLMLLIAMGMMYSSLTREQGEKIKERTRREVSERTTRELSERLETVGASQAVIDEISRRFQAELAALNLVLTQGFKTPEPAEPAATPPPRPGGPVQSPMTPQQPAPTEPGGMQGSLKPFVCAQGLQGALGIDCSPEAPMASQQLLCNLGFDELFALDCGPNDRDGPETSAAS